jgi:hypothetical protein
MLLSVVTNGHVVLDENYRARFSCPMGAQATRKGREAIGANEE